MHMLSTRSNADTTSSEKLYIALIITVFLWPKYVTFAPSVSPYSICLFFCAIASVMAVFARRGLGGFSDAVWKPASLLLAAFFLVRIVSDLFSWSLESSLYFDVRELFLGASIYFITILMVREKAFVERIAQVICLSVLPIFLSAWFEQMLQHALHRHVCI